MKLPQNLSLPIFMSVSLLLLAYFLSHCKDILHFFLRKSLQLYPLPHTLYLPTNLPNHLFLPYFTLLISSSEQALPPSCQQTMSLIFASFPILHQSFGILSYSSHSLFLVTQILSSGYDSICKLKISISYHCSFGIFTQLFYPTSNSNRPRWNFIYILPSIQPHLGLSLRNTRLFVLGQWKREELELGVLELLERTQLSGLPKCERQNCTGMAHTRKTNIVGIGVSRLEQCRSQAGGNVLLLSHPSGRECSSSQWLRVQEKSLK